MARKRAISATIKVDSDKIRAKLEEKGYSMVRFGKELGYEASFLSNALVRGTMTKPSFSLLAYKLGCTEDELLYKEKEIPSDETPVAVKSDECAYNTEVLAELKTTNELLRELIKVWSN